MIDDYYPIKLKMTAVKLLFVILEIQFDLYILMCVYNNKNGKDKIWSESVIFVNGIRIII